MDNNKIALQSLARALAPFIAEELGLEHRAASSPEQSPYDDETCRQFVGSARLGDTVLLRAKKFFGALASSGRIGSLELVDLLELKGATSIPANLTNPLKKRAARLDRPVPWSESVGADGRTVWLDRDGNAQRMLTAIEEEIARRRLVIAANPSKFVWEEGDVEILTHDEVTRIMAAETGIAGRDLDSEGH